MEGERSANGKLSTVAPQLSVWALAALLCSMAALCPAATLLGPLLGLRALLQIKARPEQFRGAKYAWWAIGLGLGFTVVWLLIGAWWNLNVRQPLKHGPVDELRAGLSGDIARFKAGFHGSETTSDAEAATFLQAVRQRYGNILFTMAQADDASRAQLPTQGRAVIPYQLRFDRGAADAQAQFMISETGGPPMVLKWGWIRIIDANSGDLVYPATAEGAKPQAATQPIP